MPTDAIDVLVADHRKVEALFARIEAGEADDYVVAAVVRELSIHDAVEREHLYPTVRGKIPLEGDALAERSLDDHEEQARLLREIDRAPDRADRLELLGALMPMVREHVAQEESKVFPLLAQLMAPADLAGLGSRLEDAKTKAPTHPHPSTPRSPGAAQVAGRLAHVVDALRDLRSH